MVVMRLDEETAKVMDPAKGSRRKQSKPNRVSLVDQPPIGGQHHAAAQLSSDPKPEVDDADLPHTSGLQEGVHGEVVEGDDMSADHEEYEDSDAAAHLSEGCAAPDYPCHYCGRSFSSRESLDQHEHDAHLSADAEHSDLSGEFPTAYHRLASEFAQQTKGGVIADAPVGASHEAMETAPDPDTEASGGTPQLLASGVFHPEAYCEICQREFCNKYFLKTHKANIHGIVDPGGSSVTSTPKAATPPRTNPMPEREYAAAAAAAAASVGGVGAQPATSSAGASPVASAMIGAAVAGGGGGGATAAAAAAAAVAASINKEMYSGVISSGGDICDICQKPFRNKYYIKRHKLHVHGVASPGMPVGGMDRAVGGPAAGYTDPVQPRPSPDGAAVVGAAAAQPGSSALLAEGSSDVSIADSLVGCNMCTRKFSSMHAVKIHRASAHGVYARDLAAAAAAAAGLSTPTGRGLSSLLLADAAAAAAAVGANGSAVGTIVGRIDRAAAGGDHAVAIYKRAPGGTIGNMNVAALYPATAAASLAAGAAAAAAAAATTGKHGSSTFESPSRVPVALATQVGSSAALQLPLVAAHGLVASSGDAVTGVWHGTLPSSNGPNAPAPIIALSYHGPTGSAATAVAGTADGEARQVSLQLPQPLSSDVPLDAKDASSSRDAQVNCDLCQKSFSDVHHLRAHKLTAHGADASSLELSATADAVAAAPGCGPASLPFASGYVGQSADGAAGSVATEYKQWRWKEHANQTRVYCDICNKELCNKYFLRTHKWKKHGIGTTPDGVELQAPNPSAGATAAAAIAAAAAAASAGAAAPAACSPRGRIGGNTGSAAVGLPQAAAAGASAVGFEPSAVDGAAEVISQQQQQQYPHGSFDPDSEGPDHSSASSGLSSGHAEGTSPEGRAAAGGDAGLASSHAIACHFCGSEFSDLQAAVAHACEQSVAAGCGGGGGVPLDGSGAAGAALLPAPDGDELKGGSGSGSLPLGALLGMQKFSWKSRGGRTAAAGGGGGAASAGEKLYSCSRCDYKTPWLSNIYSHEQRKHGGGGTSARGSGAAPHTCTVCLRTFSYEHSLMRHMADYHNGTGSGGSVIVTTSGSSAAGVGGVASVTPGAVAWPRRHQRSRCPYCNKQFVNKLLCQSHIRSAHGAASAALATGSGLMDGAGNSSNGYTVIRAGATGYKVYACDRCGFKCRTLSNLRVHQLVKHVGLTAADVSVDGALEPDPMDTAESIADANSATGVKEETFDESEDALTNGSAGALVLPSASVLESLPGVSMQPFVIESVDGASEFACASVQLPVFKKVNGSVQVTLTLRPIDI